MERGQEQYVYLLEHSYEYDIGDGETADEIKTLGIFTTEEEGKSAIEYYKTLEGFKDYPEDCFYLDRFELNKRFWVDGFFTPSDEDDE